jgi:hypothetical protein
MTPGDHSVGLYGLAVNCVIAGGDTRTITINTISCVTPATFSILRISTLTAGAGTDPDGYITRVDDGEWRPIPSGSSSGGDELDRGIEQSPAAEHFHH